MMLKSFGIDPEQIKKQVTETAAKLFEKVEQIEAAQARIETKLDFVLGCLEKSIPLAPGNMDAMNAIESEPETLQRADVQNSSEKESGSLDYAR